jgi:predicted dehydrogenase
MSVLRVGLIGCGNVVRYGHGPALRTVDGLKLVALADVTEARRKIGQEWFGLSNENLYAGHQDLLARKDVDAVVVTVPQQFRRQIVLDALAAGKHVLSEKPIAYSPAVAAELIAAANQAGLTFGMVHNYVFFPEYRQIKQLLDSGQVGDLRVLTMHYLGVIDNPGAAEYKSDWRHTMGSGGGVLTDMIHAVYLTEWLFGAQAQQVMAFVDAPTYAQRGPVVEDLALLQLAFPTGYATIHMGWGQGVGGVDASGSAGHLRMRYNQYQTSGFNQPAELYSVRDWQRTDHALENWPNHLEHTAHSFKQIWADFRDAVQQKCPTVAPASAGQRALEIVLGAYLSGATGQVVKLPLPTDHPVYREGIEGMQKVTAWADSRTKAAGLFGLRGG